PSGNGFFSGELSLTLTVKKRNLIVTAGSVSITYGDPLPSVYSLKYTGFINNDTITDLTVLPTTTCNATAQSNAGEYVIIPSGGEAPNYKVNPQLSVLTIEKRNLTVTPDNATRMYGDPNPDFTLSYTGFVNDDTESDIDSPPTATTTAGVTDDVGEYDITVAGGNAVNYDFTCLSGTLTVEKRNLTVTPENVSRTYGDENPDFTLSYEGFVNDDTVDVIDSEPTAETTADITANVGEYEITVDGGDAVNYDFAFQPGTLTIEKRLLTVTPDNVTRMYGDENPAFTLSYTGFVNGDTESVITTKPTASTMADVTDNAGEYPITVSDGNATNYDFTYRSGTLTIEKRLLTVTPNNATRTYGDANPAFVLSYTGFVNGDTESSLTSKPTATTTADVADNAGEYPIAVSDGNATNYDFSYRSGTLTVTKAPLTITADDRTYQQGDPDPVFTLTYSGFRNGDDASVLDELPQITCSVDKDSPAGIYDIILSNGHDNNYNYTLVNGRLEVLSGMGIAETLSVIRVYPNPVRDILYIQSAAAIEQVIIRDLNGKILKQVDSPSGEVNVSDLAAGVYLVGITTAAGEIVRKIVINE
ncbi:MAG: T9SS type A sorting domain-containing protein, partial [Prevotellaceae bacterium]|nr:T9SS type A sorting domain-containing protein [Prevotellaceae bacterium]